jgi:hypothetical protein
MIKILSKKGDLLSLLLEDGVPAVTAGISVAVVRHEVSASTSITEWALSFKLTINDLIVLANSIRH